MTGGCGERRAVSATPRLACVLLLVAGCSDEVSILTPGGDLPLGTETAAPSITILEPAPGVAPRTGFIELEETEYTYLYGSTAPLRSSATRLFFNLIPADEDAESKPLIVLFNGGLGSTSMYLHSLGTGPYTLSEADWSAPPSANPASFTQLGNLLYIDSRQAGFSYGLASDPADDAERLRAFDEGSFNGGIDAADFVRVLLRVLSEQPDLRDNPVVLLGESAGGQRAATMLEILLDPPRLDGEPPLYQDASLEAEIAQHYAAVFGADDVATLTTEMKARQFGWQVLIQPTTMMGLQGDVQLARQEARSERLAALPGYIDDQCDHLSQPLAWCNDRDEAVVRAMLEPAEFQSIIGVPPSSVPYLLKDQRAQAFRCRDSGCSTGRLPPSASPAWSSELGELAPFDRYFMDWINLDSYLWWYPLDHDDRRFSFVRILPHVETLITNALWDDTVDAEAIVPTLRDAAGYQAKPWLASADYDGDDPDAVSESIIVRYDEHPVYGPARTRQIRFPHYEHSGHMVTASEPQKFHDDVRAFLSETGALAPMP
jgi:serine carboxypeptidase